MPGVAEKPNRSRIKSTSAVDIWYDGRPTLGTLFRGLKTDFSTLLRLEVQLARVETREKLDHAMRPLGRVVGGVSLFYTGIVVLMMSAAVGYALFLPFWLAVLLIGLFVLVVGAMLIQVGRKLIGQTSLLPRRTITSIRADAAMFRRPFAVGASSSVPLAPASAPRSRRPPSTRESQTRDREQSVTKRETTMWQILKETVDGWLEDNASQLAAALSYYTAVSIAPLLVLIVVLVGLVLGGQQAVESRLLAQMRGAIGNEGAQFLEAALESAQQPTLASLAGILSFIALLWGSTNVFAQLQNSLNAIWNVEPKPGRGIWGTIRDRFLSFTMVLGIAFLLLVSLVISSVLVVLIDAGQAWLPGIDWLWQVVNYVASFVVITLVFAAIYKVLPDVEISWRHVWLGAAITAALFMIGQFALNLYLDNAGTTYGAVGSLVIFLLWVYYSAQILFLGAEFTQVYARHYGVGIQPAPNAVRTEPTPAQG